MTIDGFSTFAQIVASSFQEVARGSIVFVSAVDGEALYEEYLAAFPPGTNLLYKKRTEHDCSCCKQFIRRAGAVVSPIWYAGNGDDATGEMRTIWDRAVEEAPAHYRTVASRLQEAVRRAPIGSIYRVSEKETSFGTAQSRAYDKATGQAMTWDHFYTGNIPRALRVESPAQVRGDYETSLMVFRRGLLELTPDALETVLSLIEAGSLYRGEEHKLAVSAFQRLQREFLSIGSRDRGLFLWMNAGHPAARLRNTVIGTLVQDLSEGQDIDRAVTTFETKVAPQNYKRTSALITPGMVKKAMETIEALGLEPALERRLATIADLSVNDVKWVDGSSRSLMKGGIGDALMKHATSFTKRSVERDEENAEEIGLDDFVARVLPETTSLEIFFRGDLAGNLMSITAPRHPEPKRLFRWDNDFAWSYGGNVADSIKERVRKAGGKVDGAVLRVSLSWFNYDDLDLHVYEPPGRALSSLGDHIFFRNKRGWTGGVLDVDMNAGRGTTRKPVENIVWMTEPPDGGYRVLVHNYCHREASSPGFVVEVETGGRISHYSYNKAVRNEQAMHVVHLYVKNGVVERFALGDPGITAANISQEKWGLKTEQYVKVRAVTLSPNYWGDNAVGNKHTFFLLEGARCDEETRGFYNEFLHPRLEPHRKVFEVIADKTKCQPTEGGLSGLGFSSTKHESFLVRASCGGRRRLFNVFSGVGF